MLSNSGELDRDFVGESIVWSSVIVIVTVTIIVTVTVTVTSTVKAKCIN